MSDSARTSTEWDLVEGGLYGQVVTVGAYVGWNDNASGLAVGIFQQASAGPATYVSGGAIISLSGIDWGWNAGGGVAVPTGVASPVTGAAWVNADGTKTVQVGTLWTDWFEFGGYGQFGTQTVLVPIQETQAFWNDLIHEVEGRDYVDQELLVDLILARDIPSWRDSILEKYGLLSDPPKCFPAHTRIQTSLSTSVAISALRAGDIVLSYDACANKGRGGLVPRRVVRIYRNTTTEWIRLNWVEGGEWRELVATPGHHFLDQFGQFPTIAEMIRTGRATVVLASGALTEVTAERIVYSAETAHLFERAVAHAAARKALRSRFDSSNDDKRTSTDAGRRGRGAGLTRRRGSRNIAVSRQGRGKTWLPASSRTACCISAIATSRARPITRPT